MISASIRHQMSDKRSTIPQPVKDKMAQSFLDKQMDQLSTKLTEGGKVKDISKEFAELSSDYERMQYLLNMDTVCDIVLVPDVTETDSKSSETAKEWKAKGNKAFQKGNYARALSFYTKSVSTAPNVFKEEPHEDPKAEMNTDLALAFANRSATLFHLEQYRECLRDIKYAIESHYPQELKYKLFDRQGKCHLALGHVFEAGNSFDEAKELLNDAKLDNKRRNAWEADLQRQIGHCMQALQAGQESTSPERHQMTVPVFPCGTHNVFSSLSLACDVMYTPETGRYITATRDIHPGQILLIEKPYASVLLPLADKTHCHHCYAYTVAPVPCFSCTSVLFCSANCRWKAWDSYHETECPILPVIYKSGVGKFGHLALRAVVKATLQGVLQCKADIGISSNRPKTLEGCNSSGKYLANDYNAICHLVTHGRDRDTHDRFKRAVTAVFLLKCLQKSPFFGSGKGSTDLNTLENLATTGSHLLSHLQSLPCNAHEISELQLDKQAVATSESLEIGAGIYSTLSLFNHSCDPAANRNFYHDTCVVRAIKSIRAGEEISDNYGAVYAVQTKDERWDKLRPQYYFQCCCEPCTNDWPLYPDIPAVNPRWRCKNCRLLLEYTLGANDGIKCPNCGQRQNLGAKAHQLQLSCATYNKAFERLLQCKVGEAIPGLLSHLECIQEVMALPWQEFNSCQEALKQCYSIQANCRVIGD